MTTERGRHSEEIATRFLLRSGIIILYRNYRSPYGEIDIVGSGLAHVIFIEVRARRSAQFLRPIASISRQKQHRISSTAQYFLAHYVQWQMSPCRFDVIELIAPGTAQQQLHWHKNAFELDATYDDSQLWS